jgi:hypothetical protein
MTAIIIDDKAVWDDFVDKSRHGMLFHKWDFMKIAERYSGHTLYPYGFFKGSELVAVIPLFVKKHLGYSEVVSPPPRCDIPYMGLVPGSQFDAVKQSRRELYWQHIMENLDEALAKLAAKSIHFKLSPGVADIRQFLWRGFIDRARFSYTFDLKRPLEDLWKGLDQRTRQYTKNEHISIEPSNDSDLIYSIMSDRYRQQNIDYTTCIAHKNYLRELMDAYPDNLKMHIARHNGKVANIRLDCLYKDLYLEWIGCVNLDQDIRSNEFFRWHFIKEAKALGYGTYESYGADVMRLCESKNKYNPSLCSSYEVHKVSRELVIVNTVYFNGKKLINRIKS